MKLISHSLTPQYFKHNIRSLARFGNASRHPQPYHVSTLLFLHCRLALQLFRREPAITTFDQLFTPIHRSSEGLATPTRSVLQYDLSYLQPAHGQITWFRVHCQQLSALFRLGFPPASTFPVLTLLLTITRWPIRQQVRSHPFGLLLLCQSRISKTISLPYQGFFSPFPHGTMRYRCKQVFSLGAWSPRIHTGFLVSDATRDSTTLLT